MKRRAAEAVEAAQWEAAAAQERALAANRATAAANDALLASVLLGVKRVLLPQSRIETLPDSLQQSTADTCARQSAVAPLIYKESCRLEGDGFLAAACLVEPRVRDRAGAQEDGEAAGN